ncbi:MAG: hypothetical protein GF311_14335 [Candidatus Lokiarchaeota archaeon]|nr:hypothetical protein [Candidatus Lokiarchaeota archaeon]
MRRQKSLTVSYKEIAEIEESLEKLGLSEFHSDKKYEMLEIFSIIKYISETITYLFQLTESQEYDFQVVDVVEFLYLKYFLSQLESVKTILDNIKDKTHYEPDFERLLKRVDSVIAKIQLIIKDEKFLF